MSISTDFYMQLAVERARASGAVEKEETIQPRLSERRALASSGPGDCKVPEKLLLHVPIFGARELRHTLARRRLELNRNRRGKI